MAFGLVSTVGLFTTMTMRMRIGNLAQPRDVFNHFVLDNVMRRIVSRVVMIVCMGDVE
jgi:hypothetical protein